MVPSARRLDSCARHGTTVLLRASGLSRLCLDAGQASDPRISCDSISPASLGATPSFGGFPGNQLLHMSSNVVQNRAQTFVAWTHGASWKLDQAGGCEYRREERGGREG